MTVSMFSRLFVLHLCGHRWLKKVEEVGAVSVFLGARGHRSLRKTSIVGLHLDMLGTPRSKLMVSSSLSISPSAILMSLGLEPYTLHFQSQTPVCFVS